MAQTGMGKYNWTQKGDSDYAPGTNSGSGGATDLIWEDRIRTLRDLITSGKYPCVVKVRSGDVSKFQPGGQDVSAREDGLVREEVLQLLEMRRHKVVVLQKLHWDRRTDEYQKSDKETEMRVTQKGWFEVLPDNGQPVEYFDTINAITAIRPKQFLVRTSIVGYQLSVENVGGSWMPWEIRPGEILTTGIIHMDQKKAKRKTLLKRIFSSSKGSGKKEQELRYLQCFDRENREIMVPLITTGVFSPVGDHTTPNYDAVYNLHDLISAFNLPIKVQLIHTDGIMTESVPTGVLLLDRLKDTENVIVAKHPYVEGETETFEIPLDEGFHVVRAKKKKGVAKKSPENDNDIVGESTPEISDQVDLPIRVKDNRKSKGSAILDKLSVRSKAKKERASLKALQEQGIFSSRLSKSEIVFDDVYCADIDCKENETDKAETETKAVDSSNVTGRGTIREQNNKRSSESGYSRSVSRGSMQDRDLPPIPNKGRSPKTSTNKESDYDELPLAPRPPNKNGEFYLDDDQDHSHDDGYMTPARFREINDELSRGEFDVVVKRKPPTAPRDSIRCTRARKVKSEYGTMSPNSEHDAEDIDQMFDFTYAETGDAERESDYAARRQQRDNMYAKVNKNRKNEEEHQILKPRRISYDDDRRFRDDTALEPKPLAGFAKLRSRSHKNLNVESNATIRSHNVRKMRTAMDVFNFSDSLRDLRQPMQNGDDQSIEPTYGRVVDNERVKSYVYGEQNVYGRTGGMHYVESEPSYRRYHRSSSTVDLYPKHGDDSAISLCSRGEYGGAPGDSEYSYSEYSKWHDDGWIPPEEVEGLSVLEVSKSLRYIGMKDRVVIRFAHEQIDGNMLCSLDKKLLKEGFPELNALEIKKIMDFVDGWRPKK